MKPLTFKSPSNYFINHTKHFSSIQVTNNDLIKAFQFAFEMCFRTGHHRSHRTGGQLERNNGEKFCNTFQGKLSEIVLFNYFVSNNLNCSDVDYRIMGAGEWDDRDFIINNKNINVKSAAHFSNLLLLEEKDWTRKGYYIPDMQKTKILLYDFFVLIRIKPDIKSILKMNKLFYSKIAEKELLKELIFTENWCFDIPGFITHFEFVNEVISKHHILPQNALLNGKTPMDASNYYVQTGDLNGINELMKLL